MGIFKDVVSEMTVVTSTGTTLVYKYSRVGGEDRVTREIFIPDDIEKVDTGISDIESDGNALIEVAKNFRQLSKVKRI